MRVTKGPLCSRKDAHMYRRRASGPLENVSIPIRVRGFSFHKSPVLSDPSLKLPFRTNTDATTWVKQLPWIISIRANKIGQWKDVEMVHKTAEFNDSTASCFHQLPPHVGIVNWLEIMQCVLMKLLDHMKQNYRCSLLSAGRKSLPNSFRWNEIWRSFVILNRSFEPQQIK